MARSGAQAETPVSTGLPTPSGHAAAARAARRARRFGTLVRRCAWCDRYEFGSQWFAREDVPNGFRERVAQWTTDGICQDCLDELQATRRVRVARPSLPTRP